MQLKKVLRKKYMLLNVYELERKSEKESNNMDKKSMKQATNNRET